MTWQAFAALFAVLIPVWACVKLERRSRRKRKNPILIRPTLNDPTNHLPIGELACARASQRAKSNDRSTTDATQKRNRSEHGRCVTCDAHAARAAQYHANAEWWREAAIKERDEAAFWRDAYTESDKARREVAADLSELLGAFECTAEEAAGAFSEGIARGEAAYGEAAQDASERLDASYRHRAGLDSADGNRAVRGEGLDQSK